jgi:hypothetical protein
MVGECEQPFISESTVDTNHFINSHIDWGSPWEGDRNGRRFLYQYTDISIRRNVFEERLGVDEDFFYK